MNYFKRREEYKQYAIDHTKEMDAKYPDQILYSVNNSEVLSGPDSIPVFHIGNVFPHVEYLDAGTSDAIMQYEHSNCNIWALNFASYKNPGGMFIAGSSAQEESLCRDSFLYNVLSHPRFKEYYRWNRQNLNNGMYKNRMIISPNIQFERWSILDDGVGSPYHQTVNTHIITCAAPNYSGILKRGLHNKQNYDKNLDALLNRIRFILTTLEGRVQTNDVIILGAFGCGVFKQDPAVVSDMFVKNLYLINRECKVIFAVPSKYKAHEYFKNITMTQTQNEDMRSKLLSKYSG